MQAAGQRQPAQAEGSYTPGFFPDTPEQHSHGEPLQSASEVSLVGKGHRGICSSVLLEWQEGLVQPEYQLSQQACLRQSLMGKDKGHKRAGMAPWAGRAPGGHVVRVAHGSKGKAGPERKGDLLEIPQPVSWQN